MDTLKVLVKKVYVDIQQIYVHKEEKGIDIYNTVGDYFNSFQVDVVF